MGVPENAVVAFKGEIFTVHQWPQEMFDGSVATFESISRAGTVTVLATAGDDVFYAQESQPGTAEMLSLFGGRMEEGEEPLAAARRELLEESGLASEDWSLLFQTPTYSGKIAWPRYMFLARNCRRVAVPHLDAGEKIKVCSAPLERFLAEVLPSPAFRSSDLYSYFYSAFNTQRAEDLRARLNAADQAETAGRQSGF